MHNFALNRINLPLLIPVFLLVGLGLLTLHTIERGLFTQQLTVFGIALLMYIIFINIDFRIFGFFSKVLYLVMVGMLVLVFLIGVEAKGSVRWINVLGVSLQVSEIIKPFFIIFIAQYLSSTKSKDFLTFLKTLLLLAPVFILTLRQPDLGNAIIFLVTTICIMLMHGFPLRHFFFTGLVGVITMPIFYNMLHQYQKDRLLSFIDVTRDPFGTSYNTIQALISIGSGGMMGKGFDDSTQSLLRFLPEHHTDFIFATISENLGFIGGLIIIAAYAYFMYLIYRILLRVDDAFTRLVVSGFFFLFMTHILFNIGMNVGILPIVGITLPFLSYGGSSLLTNFVILGMLSSAAFEYKKRFSYEIR